MASVIVYRLRAIANVIMTSQRRLEIDNARLEAAAKQQSNRIEVLQKGAQEVSAVSVDLFFSLFFLMSSTRCNTTSFYICRWSNLC